MLSLILLTWVSEYPIDQMLYQAKAERMMPVQKQYWVAMGVMEEGEGFFDYWWTYESDASVMLARLRDTPPDAPPLDAAHSLPDSSHAYHNYMEAMAYIRHLERRREWLLPGPEQAALDLVKQDAEWRMSVWVKIFVCSGRYSGPSGRRMDMWVLVQMVGREAFERGQWPDHLPAAAYTYDWTQDTLEGVWK